MKYYASVFIVSLLISMVGTQGYCSVKAERDTGSQGYNWNIRNSAPFLFIDMQTLSGVLKYSYETVDPQQVSYMVDYNGVGLELGIGYQIRNFGFYISGGSMYLNYWSAEHHTLYYPEDNNPDKSYIATATTEHGFPTKLIYGGVGLEYSITLSNVICLAPFITAQSWKYNDNRFHPKSLNEDIYYTLNDPYSLGGGLAFRGKFSGNSAFNIKCTLMKNNFEPIGYFESLNAENLRTSNTFLEMSFGYQFNFNGYQFGFLNHRINFY